MNRPTRRHVAIASAVLSIILTASLTGCGRDGRSEGPGSSNDQGPNEVRPKNVVVQVTTLETVEETLTLPGTVEAWEDLTLSLEQSGTIRWIGPTEGDSLAADEPVIRIDTDTLESELDRKQTEYDLKKKNLDRVESLFKEELVSQKQYDDARLAFEVAKVDLTQSRIDLEKSTLRSPIDGILDRLLVDRGEYGTVGMAAAVVVQIDRLKVIVDVPEKDVPHTAVGQKVTVLPAEVKGVDGLGVTGRIIHVGYKADPITRTYRTKIEITNPGRRYRPGMIVRIRFVRRVHENALAVPLYAIVDREGEKFVFVVENGVAIKRLVHLGPVVNGKVVVYGGLQKGEQLVIKGQQLIMDGNPVNLVSG
ncbi:MAG: efflux RND transporter periplasmic adaptor subunit [bacterium]|nr:MAG: efflux RND transporter periplasmic adaptor subunit [bacterium]